MVEFNQEKGLRVLERFGSGSFEEVMGYCCNSVEQFYQMSKDFVKHKHKYKRALEKAFKTELKGR